MMNAIEEKERGGEKEERRRSVLPTDLENKFPYGS